MSSMSARQAKAALPESERPGLWPWPQVRDYFALNHKQGEHVSAEGPNGSGKTTLMLELLIERGQRRAANGRPAHVTILETKRRDKTMEGLLGLGWKRITRIDEWPPAYGEEHVVVWPPAGDLRTRADRMKAFFETVLAEIDESGAQILYIDEAATFSLPKPDGFGFRGYLNNYWKESRSNGISLFAGTQRPVDVPRPMWSEPYWLFLFRPEDEDDLKRVAELSGSKQLVLEVLPQLDHHQFLMLRRRPERIAVVSEVEF